MTPKFKRCYLFNYKKKQLTANKKFYSISKEFGTAFAIQ